MQRIAVSSLIALFVAAGLAGCVGAENRAGLLDGAATDGLPQAVDDLQGIVDDNVDASEAVKAAREARDALSAQLGRDLCEEDAFRAYQKAHRTLGECQTTGDYVADVRAAGFAVVGIDLTRGQIGDNVADVVSIELAPVLTLDGLLYDVAGSHAQVDRIELATDFGAPGAVIHPYRVLAMSFGGDSDLDGVPADITLHPYRINIAGSAESTRDALGKLSFSALPAQVIGLDLDDRDPSRGAPGIPWALNLPLSVEVGPDMDGDGFPAYVEIKEGSMTLTDEHEIVVLDMTKIGEPESSDRRIQIDPNDADAGRPVAERIGPIRGLVTVEANDDADHDGLPQALRLHHAVVNVQRDMPPIISIERTDPFAIDLDELENRAFRLVSWADHNLDRIPDDFLGAICDLDVRPLDFIDLNDADARICSSAQDLADESTPNVSGPESADAPGLALVAVMAALAAALVVRRRIV